MAEDVLAAKQFKDSLELALQQRDSKLSARCMNSTYTGEGARMLGSLSSVEMQAVTSKRDPIVPADTTWSMRWTTPQTWDLALQLDRKEQAAAFSDPKSVMVEASRAAVERKKDKVFLNAIFGDALTGKAGTTSVSWATEGANQIVQYDTNGLTSGSAVRLNTKKLRMALKFLKRNQIDRQYEDIFVGIDAEQSDALYEETVFISKEYTADAFTRNDKGIITSFMGFQFVEMEGLPNDGTYTRIPVWTRMGMDFGVWDTPMTKMYEDMQFRGNPWTIYTYQSFSAARRDPKRIVEIKCKVSA